MFTFVEHIKMFQYSNQIINNTSHKSITWEDYKKKPSHWFINHPTVCYRNHLFYVQEIIIRI